MFKKAVKSIAKIKLAVTGPSGSGKTYSSLLLAKGLGNKIAVVDTENGSASLYSDKFSFDVAVMSPPYDPSKYIRAIDESIKLGYEVLIIDSLSHAWAGDGGLLAKKEALDSRGKGNSYTNWASITKDHEALKAKILNSDIHIIVTMRSKQEYVLQDNNGKQVPKKVGMAPIQRDGMEYEFTTVFDLGMDHSYEVSKDRTGLFDGRIEKITDQTGKEIKEWLTSSAIITPPPEDLKPAPQRIKEPSKPVAPKEEASKEVKELNEPTFDADEKDEYYKKKPFESDAKPKKEAAQKVPITQPMQKRLWAIAKSREAFGWTEHAVRGFVQLYGIEKVSALDWHQYQDMVKTIETKDFESAYNSKIGQG